MNKIRVAVLGATGNVGQRFIELLDNHPWFELSAVAASSQSAGQKYKDVVAGKWKLSADIASTARDMVVQECKPGLDAKIVFSGLDANVAGDIEEKFAKAGYFVFSNAKNHRMAQDVPLLVPEVNFEHATVVKRQQRERGFKGFIVTNPNCTTIGLVMALASLHKDFGVSKVLMTSMQALSGAGYPGVPSMDILDNVVPYIGGEEEKVEAETLKLLGGIRNQKFVMPKMAVSAHCNRVNVADGHTETVSIGLDKQATMQDIMRSWRNYAPLKGLNLPSAPEFPVVYRTEQDRPQPRLDRMTGRGMSAVTGRLRKCGILDWKFVVLSHNTIRGAAGCSILNAEYFVASKLIA